MSDGIRCPQCGGTEFEEWEKRSPWMRCLACGWYSGRKDMDAEDLAPVLLAEIRRLKEERDSGMRDVAEDWRREKSRADVAEQRLAVAVEALSWVRDAKFPALSSIAADALAKIEVDGK